VKYREPALAVKNINAVEKETNRNTSPV